MAQPTRRGSPGVSITRSAPRPAVHPRTPATTARSAGSTASAARRRRARTRLPAPPPPAVARAARDDRVDHDPRAHRDAHIGTNRLHDARGLVAEHHWVAHAGMLPGVDGKVRVADGSGGDANERRAPTGPRRGPFGHLEAARRLENGG